MVYLEMSLGGNAVKSLRETLMYHGLDRFLTDEQQSPHMTYLRKYSLSDEEKDSLMKMMHEQKTGRITLDVLSLREKKTGELVKPSTKEYNLWKE